METTPIHDKDYLRTILNAVQTGILVIDAENHKIVYANPAAFQIIGHPKELVIGAVCHSFICPAEVGKCPITDLGQTVDNSERAVIDARVERVPVLKTVVATVIEGHRYLVESFLDIRERKQLEEELRHHSEHLKDLVEARTTELATSERKYRDLFENANDLIQCVDSHGRFEYVNKTWLQTLGYTLEEARQLTLMNILREDQVPHCMELFKRVSDGEALNGVETVFVSKDGREIFVEGNVNSQSINGQFVATRGIFRDITERKRMGERLVRSERLAAIGETAAMVGHDLRNPLQGIAGALNLLKQESLTAEERSEMLQVIEKSVHYSDSIIRDLSDYSAEIKLKLAEATPKSLTSAAIGTVKVPQHVTVQDLSEDQPTLRVDPEMMRRVFINLIENAIDAMPQGGTLTISSRKSDCNVEIALTDTGSGISEKVMENLWKPLQTTKSKGLGLGLAICKRLVDAHGGNMSVKSEVGRGTTFTMQLPIRPVEVKQK